MISSTLKVIGCLLAVCFLVHAQTPAQKAPPGSISGKVTLKGNGLAGITVGARRMNTGPAATLLATTDQDGIYRLSNVAAGEYEIMPAAPQYVGARAGIKRVIVGDGENVQNIDFSLVRGGAITGKITDADGRPVIEEPIEIHPEGPGSMERLRPMNDATDDRGVYRVYGLPPGKYRISAGVSEEHMYLGNGRRTVYSQTFHPSATDSASATVVEVTEGGEVTNVDITLRRLKSVYTVTARVIDADTGQPVPDASYTIENYREHGSSSNGGYRVSRQGEIKLENLPAGKYALYVESSAQRAVYAEPVKFEVVDQDIKDLVIKTSSGSTISGEIVFEGVDEKVVRQVVRRLLLYAFVMNPESHSGHASSPSTQVNADNTFTLGGLRPGSVLFSISQLPSATTEFEVARIERDGVVLPRVEIKGREQIKGLRLIVRTRSGGIRGLMKYENGQLPPNTFVQIHVKKVGADNGTSAEVDDRGRFVTERLSAGVYEVEAWVYWSRGRPRSAKQQVVVTENQMTEITLTVDLSPDPGQVRP